MKFQNKLILSFGATVVVVVVIIGLLQFVSTNHLVHRLSSDNVDVLGKEQHVRANGVNDALQFSMQQFLARGQMDVFGDVAKLQQQIEGFREFSLYNGKGVITYSSDKNALKRVMNDTLKSRLYQQPGTFLTETNGFIEIYQPLVTQKSCLDCHNDSKLGSVCGVTLCRFSTEAMTSMRAQCEKGAAQISRAGFLNGVATIIAGIFIAGLIAYLVTRSITRPILKVAADLSMASDETAAAADQLGRAGASLVDTSSEQAAASEESAVSISEMREQAGQSSKLTEGASDLMKDNLRKSGDSLRAIVEMNHRMSQMQADSGEIRKIMKTIDEIAFQTNLLALNAAVEAARAGAAGTGFAVVAEEVRALAGRSAEAAKNTQSLLDNMARRIIEGANTTKAINDNFEGIVESATAMGDKIEKITISGREIFSGLEQVNAAASQSAQAAQKVAAISEETSAASEELNAQARAMRDIVNRLDAIVHGNTALAHSEDFRVPQKPVAADLSSFGIAMPAGERSLDPGSSERKESKNAVLFP
jgi:methyl-accepting chemotaxis protein